MGAPRLPIDERSLKSAAAVLHDARFVREGIEFDRANHSFLMKCWIKNEGRWTAYQLVLEGVQNWRIVEREKIEYYEIATVRFDKSRGQVNLITHFALEIVLETSALKGSLIETVETRSDWQ
jgi:hypothetical protein